MSRQWLLVLQMFISVDGRLAGLITLADHLRSDAAATVAYLQNKGYSVYMLSGNATSQHTSDT